MKDLGEMHYYLSIELWKEDGKNLITQSKYINELIIRFNMSECNLVSTPFKQNVKLFNYDDTKEVNVTLYQQLVGSLNYLTTKRSDISYSISILSQFMAKPHENHWKVVKRFIRYLTRIVDFGIEYNNHLNVELTCYSYSNWEGDLDDIKPAAEYAFSIGSRIMSWSTKKPPIVSLFLN